MHDQNREQQVSIKDIDDDEYFKISRNFKSPELIASLKNSGMLEVPYLIKRGSFFSPFTCHNRLAILSETGISSVNAIVLDTPPCEVFLKKIMLKIFRNEIGPAGRIKSVYILKNYFGMEGDELYGVGRKVLKVPDDILSDEKFIGKVLNFPSALRNYIDQKDLSLKVIKDLVASGDDFIQELNRWIENIQIRLNIFKMLVDFLFDIRRRDGKIDPVSQEALIKMDDKELYDTIFRLRYPDYASRKADSEHLIGLIARGGVCVDFPEFFEKDRITFRFEINRKEKAAKLQELVSSLDYDAIDRLLKLI